MDGDRELWLAARSGVGDAYSELYRRHASAVLNHCFRRTASWELAEDITSVTFLETWRRRDRVEVETSLLPWLLGVANHTIRRQARTLRRHRAALERLPPVDEADHADLVAQRLDDQSRMAAAHQALATLTRVEQETFSLCVWAGLSYEDAAVAMGVPVGTVRSRLARARSRLRAAVPDPPPAPAVLRPQAPNPTGRYQP